MLKQLFKVVAAYGARIIIALKQRSVHFAYYVGYFAVLHTLYNGIISEAFAHFKKVIYNDIIYIVPRLRQLAHKGMFYFDIIYMQTFEHFQRRISRAEIVKRHFKTSAAKPGKQAESSCGLST